MSTHCMFSSVAAFGRRAVVRSKIFRSAFAAAIVLSAAAASTVAAQRARDGASVTAPRWQLCAWSKRQCKFNGRRRVRFGASSVGWSEAVYTDGVICARENFEPPVGDTDPPRWGVCTYDTSQTISADDNSGQPSSDDDGDGVVDADGAGTTEGEGDGDDASDDDAANDGEDEDTGGSGGDGDDASDDDGSSEDEASSLPSESDADDSDPMHAGSAAGPHIDGAAIPPPAGGSSRRLVVYTNEVPGPSEYGNSEFGTVCGFSHMAYDDPIVFPGQPGKSHLHVFLGNTLTNAHSTASSLQESGASTCRGGIADRSAYWVPAVVDGSGVPQVPLDSDMYYQSGYEIDPEDVQPIPPGLRIIAGNDPADHASKRSEDVRYECSADATWTPYSSIPSCPGGATLTMVIDFPQCWDGVNLDSPDHRSHMAYPEGFRCPASHPVPLPLIAFNIHYAIPAGSNSRDWRLSSDTYESSRPGGLSLHGDWFYGWEQEVIDQIVRECASKPVNCKSHLIGREQATGRYQAIE